MEDIIKISPRDYQKNIFETAKSNNTLVVLPTGVGKTLIALLLSVHRIKSFPTSKILFLAPTRPLVEQHFNTFKKNLPELFADLQLFTGSVPAKERKKIFQTAEIIFSTPQCIANDTRKGLYTLSEVSLLIIDEAHRCLKNYDYTSVVKFYKNQSENPRILGLTASPGHESSKIKEICNHLDIEEIEIRTRDSEDVKPYLQTLDFEKVEVPFPPEFIELRVLLQRLFNSCINKLRERNVLFGPANKITLLKLQSRLSKQISSNSNPFQAYSAVSLTAQAIKISHALELLETQTLSGLSEYLKNLKSQSESKKSRAVQSLVNSPEFSVVFLSLQQLLEKGIEHPKISALYSLIETQFKESPNSKVIVFSQFRETASTIKKSLSKIPSVFPEMFLGQAKKSGSSGISGLNQKQQKQILQDFRDGKINVLCATSIGEEGLDIPEVSSVIFYEPIPSAIRTIQRTGRTARLSPGKLFIIMTKDTRDIAHHYASTAREKSMHKTIQNLKEEMKEKNKNPSLDKFK